MKTRKGLHRVAGAVFLQGAIASCSSRGVEPAPAEAAPAVAASGFEQNISPILGTYCTGCHAGGEAPAGIDLTFASEEEARAKAATDESFWSRVARNVDEGRMPPSFARAQPTDEERARLVDWINSNVLTANGMMDPGPFAVRRLNAREYENTVKDLLYLPGDYDLQTDFPADERGDGGFDNHAATLTISPLLIERYLSIAEKATTVAFGLDPDASEAERAIARVSRERLNEPSEDVDLDFSDWQVMVRVNLERFAPRAFRRPVTEGEIEDLMRFAALSFTHNGESRNAANALAMRAALLSPEFLFRLERDPNPDGTGKVYELTEYQLASRLSYFLWSSMPDDSLFIAARDGTLRSNLDVHVQRMLQDPKAISLTKDFVGQWLEIRGLEHVPNVPGDLLTSMQGETEHFFDYIVRQDRSIMDFLDSDYTFVNGPLADVYGIEGVEGEEFQRVEVDPTRRGGIFTQASFLTLTSKPLGDTLRTSPVVRGKWILENIFNETIPPPPPDVPELEFDANEELTGTVREIFEQHRVDPSCASCHARMDPYGFALENYDGFGAWRDEDRGSAIDASGEIDGTTFTTPDQFRRIMADRRDDFRHALVRKMLSYALGRSIQPVDRATIDEITESVKADGDRFSSLILGVVESYPFQHARASTADVRMPVTASQAVYHPVPAMPDSASASDNDPDPGPANRTPLDGNPEDEP